MGDYAKELEKRTEFIRDVLKQTEMADMVYGNGGKGSALVEILCKAACENTDGTIMPCAMKRNYRTDRDDALTAADCYNIEKYYPNQQEMVGSF